MILQDPSLQNKVYKVGTGFGWAVVVARSPERAKELLTQELYEVCGNAVVNEIPTNEEQVILTEM